MNQVLIRKIEDFLQANAKDGDQSVQQLFNRELAKARDQTWAELNQLHKKVSAELDQLRKQVSAEVSPIVTNHPRSIHQILADAEAAKITRKALVEHSGVQYSTIWRIENGIHTPNLKTLQRLEYALAQIKNDVGI